jgi:hypothetical protein
MVRSLAVLARKLTFTLIDMLRDETVDENARILYSDGGFHSV